MSNQKAFRFNASDVLGALALEAERVCAAAKLYAHGAAFPDPELMGVTIARMTELNQILVSYKQETQETQPNGAAAVN